VELPGHIPRLLTNTFLLETTISWFVLICLQNNKMK